MPPEPSPWDRKEAAFRERKHERGPPEAATGAGSGPFPAPRWRDPHRGPREFYSPSPRRAPSGHYKQAFAEETPSRSEDEGFRCYSGRYGSSSGREGGGRDGRVGYMRRSPWNAAKSLRPHQENGGSVQRSVPDLPKPASSPSASSTIRVRAGGDDVDDDGPGTGHRNDRERDNSLGSISWKPLKWPRSGSFASSAKTTGSAPEEGKPETPAAAGNESPVSPQAELLPASDDGHPRKKQRLGWGQGLAKYEKERVEVSEVNPGKVLSTVPQLVGDGADVCSVETSSNLSTTVLVLDSPSSLQTGSSSLTQAPESSLLVISEASECKKLVTVSSVLSPVLMPDNCSLDSSIEIDDLDINLINRVSSFLVNLLQYDDTSATALNFTGQAALDKLLSLKGEVSKLIEKAEAVIDSCEIELKSLNEKDESNATHSYSILTRGSSSSSSSRNKDLVAPIVASLVGSHNKNLLQEQSDVHENYNGAKGLHISHSVEIPSRVDGSTCLDAKPHAVGSFCGVEYTKDANRSCDTSKASCKEDSGSLLVIDDVHSHIISNMCARGQDDLCPGTKICNKNRELARMASDVFADFSSRVSHVDKEQKLETIPNPRIKEILKVRKHSLRFKERILTLKFKAFHHLWREDLRLLDLLSAKRNASKPQKRSETRCYLSQNGQQKPRSSTRSRHLLPAGNVALSPTSEILDVTNKLILGSEIEKHRRTLNMPVMILEESENRHSRFISSNGFVEDPSSVEMEKALINPWTEEEQKVFMEKLILFGKDFRKIASFLDHKTTADCIEFYYKNHKLDSFEAVRMILHSRKQSRSLSSSNYMVAQEKKWKNETNGTSLDMLGAASVIVSRSHDIGVRSKSFSRFMVGSNSVFKMSCGNPPKITVDSQAETMAADVLAGIGSAMSSEGISSCVTGSVDPLEKLESMNVDRPLLSEVSEPICEEDAFSDEGCGDLDSIDWSDDEKSVFIRALRLYGKDFARISVCLGTRSREQCKVFFSKAHKCLGLEMVYQGPTTVIEEALLGDANGRRSDMDEACAADTDSTLCSPSSKMDTNWSLTKSYHQDLVADAADIGSSPHESIKLGSDVGVEETTLQALEIKSENEHTVFREPETQFPDSFEPSKLASEGLAATHHRNSSLESHVNPQAFDDEVSDPVTDFLSSETDAVPGTSTIHQPDVKDRIQQLGSDCSSIPVSKSSMEELAEAFHINVVSPNRKCNPAETNILFESASGGSNCHHGKYGNYCLDTLFGNGQRLQHGLNLPPVSRKKSQAVSWNPENPPSKPFIHDQVISLPQNFDLDGDKKNTHFLHRASTYNSNQTGFDLAGQTLRGYHLHSQNIKHGDLRDLLPRPVSTGDNARKNGSTLPSHLILPGLFADNCNNVGVFDPESTCSLVCTGSESAEGLLRPCLQDSYTEAEKTSTRTGNVKLFGQILSHPSSSQKPDNAEVKTPSVKENRNLNFQLPNGRPDGTSNASLAERSSDMGVAADVLGRSYGWWDGYKIQTDLLANSALCLPKCPSLVSAVAYQAKKIKPVSGRGVVQQGLFPMDVKGQIMFPELQNRPRIDGVPGFQQPARMSMNLVGGGDALGCAVVSDPVAALRLHFAKQITAPLGSNEEPHRDLGSR